MSLSRSNGFFIHERDSPPVDEREDEDTKLGPLSLENGGASTEPP